MTKILHKLFMLSVLIVGISASAKDYQITLKSDPDGAMVYINGHLVSETTPAIITMSEKDAQKNMIIKFEKDGYESKSLAVSFDKKQLKQGAVVYGVMKTNKNKRSSSDPTLTNDQMSQRVDRNNAGSTDMERAIIRWYFDSDPRGARVFYRVISSVPNEVKNTNETYLTTTPYEETRGFNILGLTYENSRNITIEIKMSKRGYEDQVKRYNVRQALDQQEISGFFELVPKENTEE